MPVVANERRVVAGLPTERRGVATVEFAICLPVVVLFVLGTIEVANAIFVQQALTSAAYEAANVASASGGTAQQAQNRAQEVLSAMGVTNGSITVSPMVTSSTPTGTVIEVGCSAPLSSNAAVVGYIPVNSLSATVRMTRL